MKRSRPPTIRSLRHDEPVPEGEPRRYRDGRGYIRLRWLVAPNTYVETYEHRLAMGMPHPRLHVHHINGDKADNRPENLQVLDRAEHAALHGQDRDGSYGQYRSREAMEKAQRAERNRAKREARAQEMADLYRQGLSTVEIAERFGIDASGVSRWLRRAGVVTRRATTRKASTGPHTEVRAAVHARARMACERCGRSVVHTASHVHHRQPRQMGGSSGPGVNLPSNLLLLCPPCHDWVESNRAAAYDAGLLVRRPHDPAATPVELAHGRVMLTTDGSYAPCPPLT